MCLLIWGTLKLESLELPRLQTATMATHAHHVGVRGQMPSPCFPSDIVLARVQLDIKGGAGTSYPSRLAALYRPAIATRQALRPV